VRRLKETTCSACFVHFAIFAHASIQLDCYLGIGPMNGFLVREFEASCQHALEKPGTTLRHEAGLKKFDGSSEASTKDSLDVVSSQQILD
jgi:hypothetical protein